MTSHFPEVLPPVVAPLFDTLIIENISQSRSATICGKIIKNDRLFM